MEKRLHNLKLVIGLVAMGLALQITQALAQSPPIRFNLSGALYQPNGQPVLQNGVHFKVEILDAAESCVLYVEDHMNQDLSVTKGGFSFEVGGGTSIQNNIDNGTSPTALSVKVFQNDGATGAFPGCGGVTNNSGDNRVIRVSYDLGGGFVAMTPNVPMSSAAYAMIAESVQGKKAADLIQVKDDVGTDLNQTNVETVFSATNYVKLTHLLNNSFTSSYSFNGQVVSNVGTPTAGGDAVNKTYSDGYVGGKTAVTTGVGPAAGDKFTMVWDQAGNQWTARAYTYADISNAASAYMTYQPNNVACVNGEILKWNATPGRWECGVDGSSGGTVTSVTAGTGMVAGTITTTGTLSVDVGTTAGKIVQLDGSARLGVIDGSQLFNVNAISLQGNYVAPGAPGLNQVLKWNGSQWMAQDDTDTGITALTGDVVASGSGSVGATIQP
ncbi:MAG: hypothetical protein AB7F86_11865, partial [Bdellovibrionales bacterium]